MREHDLTLDDPGGSDRLHVTARLMLFFLAAALESSPKEKPSFHNLRPRSGW